MIKLSSSPGSHREIRNTDTTEEETFKQPPETAAAVAGLRGQSSLPRKALPGAFQSDTPPPAARRSALDPSHPQETCCAQDLDVCLIFLARISSLLVMELLASGLEGQHGWEKANTHSPQNVFEANKFMELDHGRLFFPLEEKVQDPNGPCCPT